MNRQLCIGLFFVFFASTAQASDTTRITGRASLRPVTHAEVASQDGRFRMESSLRAAASPKQEAGGYSLSAKLAAPKSMTASCAIAGDLIFANGFD